MSDAIFTFTWHIENYFLCGLESGKCIESSAFVDSVFKHRWSLRVYPRGRTELDKRFGSIFLNRYSCDEEITVGCRLEILRKNGDILKSSEITSRKWEGNWPTWGWYEFIAQEELFTEFDWSDVFTIRCHIKSDKPREETCAAGCVSRTRIGVDKFSFHWDIKGDYSDEWSEPKIFPFSKSSTVELSWNFSADLLRLRIKKVNDDESRFIQCDLILLDKNYAEFSSERESFLFTKSTNNIWDLNTFVTKRLLKEKESLLLQNDIFKVACEIAISNGSDSNTIEPYIYPKPGSNLSSCNSGAVPALLSDFSELCTNKKHADLQLQVGGEVIPAHKCILAARSPVFSAMFDSDMTESQSGVVKIDDVDSDTMNDLIEFLYTGNVNMKGDGALKLLAAADKYQISTLAAECSGCLMSSLSLDNACEIAAAADSVHCVELKNAAINCIKTHAGSILNTEKWFSWVSDNFQLGCEIVCQLSVDVANKKCNYK